MVKAEMVQFNLRIPATAKQQTLEIADKLGMKVGRVVAELVARKHEELFTNASVPSKR